MKYIKIETIDKEEIKFLQFPKEEVLRSVEDQKERCLDMKRAMALGNLEQEKVDILFIDSKGYKRVKTTIWGVTSKYVILKQATVIPLERIIAVA